MISLIEDYLTDDTLNYLIEIILQNNDCSDLCSFVVCHKIKLSINTVINNKLKNDYKIIIRNNHLLNPLHSYDNINKIYNNKFTLNDKKLNNLILLVIKNKNHELLEILRKTVPNTMNSDKIETRLLNVSLECQNDNINPTLLNSYFFESKYIIINKKTIVDLLKNYYDDIIKFKTFIRNLIHTNLAYQDTLMIFCVINGDVNIAQILINKSNVNDFMRLARTVSSNKIIKYIETNNQYNHYIHQNNYIAMNANLLQNV